jgi:hypothetical protein
MTNNKYYVLRIIIVAMVREAVRQCSSVHQRGRQCERQCVAMRVQQKRNELEQSKLKDSL